MKSIIYKLFFMEVVFILGIHNAFSQDADPTRPSVPTIESCRMYRQALYEQRVSIYKRREGCFKKGALWVPPYPKVQTCYIGPPAHLKSEGTPYPDCYTEEDALCASQNATDIDVDKCFKEAKGSAQDEAEAKRSAWFNEKAAEYNKLEIKHNELTSAIANPGKFFIEKLIPRLPKSMVERLDLFKSNTKSALPENVELHPLELLGRNKKGGLTTIHIFDEHKTLSQRGEKLSQEVYDFLFNNSAGNGRLYSDNPVIKEIQGDAAKELKKIHSSMISQLDMLPQKMEQITLKMSRNSQNSIPTLTVSSKYTAPNRSPSNIDCSVLDGPERTDISVNTPEIFESLLEKCRDLGSK